MHVALVCLALTLPAAAGQVQILPSDLPLVVLQAQYSADQSIVEFSVRNDGAVPVIAWSVGLTWRYPDGTESSGGYSVDAYEQAAGVPTAPRDNRVLRPGDTFQHRVPAVSGRDGTRPYVLELRARAVVLAGNRGLGDAQDIESIFLERNEWRKAWTDIVSMLTAARTANPDRELAFKHAVAALKSLDSERTFQRSISSRFLRKLSSSERAGLDAVLVLEDLIQDARRHADAAERFGTPAAEK